jgi:hypothetical protein
MPKGDEFYASLLLEMYSVEDPNRKKRFEKLNPILENIDRKKAKKDTHEYNDFVETAYSYVQWNDIESVYDTTEFYTSLK